MLINPHKLDLVCAYITKRNNDYKHKLVPAKLTALIYIAFGIYGVRNNNAYLVPNDFLVNNLKLMIAKEQQEEETLRSLTEEEELSIDLVLKIYGNLTVGTINSLITAENTPIEQVAIANEVVVIPKEQIISYYRVIYNSANLANKLAKLYQALAKT